MPGIITTSIWPQSSGLSTANLRNYHKVLTLPSPQGNLLRKPRVSGGDSQWSVPGLLWIKPATGEMPSVFEAFSIEFTAREGISITVGKVSELAFVRL